MNAHDEQVFRQAYCEMVESGNAREQLIAVAQDQRRRRFGTEALAVAEGAQRWELLVNRKLVVIEPDGICTIGQPGYGNDVERLGDRLGSRMHAILLPVGNELFVCDVGGAYGFSIVERSTRDGQAQPLPADHSRPGKRRVLRVAAGETAVLDLHSHDLHSQFRATINPKECAVCFDQPRAVEFPECGHFVCCRACSLRLDRCPLCRTRFGGPALSAAHAHSAV